MSGKLKLPTLPRSVKTDIARILYHTNVLELQPIGNVPPLLLLVYQATKSSICLILFLVLLLLICCCCSWFFVDCVFLRKAKLRNSAVAPAAMPATSKVAPAVMPATSKMKRDDISKVRTLVRKDVGIVGAVDHTDDAMDHAGMAREAERQASVLCPCERCTPALQCRA